MFEYEAKKKFQIEKEEKRLAQIEFDKSKASLTPLKAKRERKSTSKYECNPLAPDLNEDEKEEQPVDDSQTVPVNQEPKPDIEETKEQAVVQESKAQSVEVRSNSREDDYHSEAESDTKMRGKKIKYKPNYSILWYRKVSFKQCDAGKLYKIRMLDRNRKPVDVSHVYSYNKVMGKDCLKGIGQALSNTNFKILAWYVNEKVTYSLVKNVKL